jgi:hypothetical protein
MLNLYTTSAEMHRSELTTAISNPKKNSLQHIPFNDAFLGSNVSRDIWDSRFTLTEDSGVNSFDIFGPNHLSSTFFHGTNQGLDDIEEEEVSIGG